MSEIAAVIPFIANRAERARKRLEMAEELARNGYDAGPIPHDVEKLAALNGSDFRPCDVGDDDGA